MKTPKYRRAPRHELPPPPSGDAQVEVGADEVRLTRHNGHKERIAFLAIDFILIEAAEPFEGRQRIDIDLRSYTANACSVGTCARGFAELEAWLLGLPGFDETDYRRVRGGGRKARRVVWQRASQPNAAWSAAPSSPDGLDRLAEGLWLEDRGQLLAWGSFEELQRQPGVKRSESFWENPELEGERRFTVEAPTVLGGLRLERLTADMPNWRRGTPPRPGLPVTSFEADVRLAADGLADLLALKAHIEARWGPPSSDETRDEGSDRSVTWQRGRQALVLRTFRTHRAPGWRHGCLLTIRHTPDLRAFYEDDYQRGLERHAQLEWLVLPVALRLPSHYAEVPEARWLPRCFVDLVQSGDQLLVWRDGRAGRIGFANRDFALIHDAAEVDMLRVTLNRWHGEVRGADLELRLRGEAEARWPQWPLMQGQGWPQFRSLGTTDGGKPAHAVQLHGEGAVAIARLLRLPLSLNEMDESY